jgi:hypothetical protein
MKPQRAPGVASRHANESSRATHSTCCIAAWRLAEPQTNVWTMHESTVVTIGAAQDRNQLEHEPRRL